MTIMQKITSSHIRAVGYDEETRTLIVTFLGGATWTYDEVPSDIHETLMAADSKGHYLTTIIKPNFKATRVPEREEVNVLAAG